ncbi:hypothetical protein BCR42DRAFT_100091 [Absidia repens]|uniref:Uncharacterized protein n=1 Tax=Absidia repens TaxID=90262 RepID=A0A1X2I842_9FUNG|nr:hypothetical protein BCR42DRAFT_100091 [Absidia repens]
MKFSIAAALVALSAASVSAADYSYSGTVYAYLNNMDHPKTSFVKKGSDSQVVTNGAGCKGTDLLPGTGDSLSGTFTTVNNQWDFNGKHDNEIYMGELSHTHAQNGVHYGGGGKGALYIHFSFFF